MLREQLGPFRLAYLEALVRASLESRQFGVLGEPRVNVLKLNLSLDGTSHGQ